MPEPGYTDFSVPYILDEFYIAGGGTPPFAITMEQSPGLFALPTHGRTHIVQRPYGGAEKPKAYTALRFSTTVRAISEEQWYALKRAKALGAPFDFSCGLRQVDTFQAVSGSVYRLTRALGVSVVPWISEMLYPTIVEYSGAVDPTAATVSGRDVTALKTGVISILYTAVHKVIFSAFPEEIQVLNGLDANISLEEILSS
jgi:hypothetical protein